MSKITYRPMLLKDVEKVPLGCQGSLDEIRRRVEELGATAMLAFDGKQHVGQLQFRRYDSQLRSPNGLWDPLYWGDFGDFAPDLSHDTLSVFCYHVGQLGDSEARDPSYQGQGIGLAMLDHLLSWASKKEFKAVVAKCTPPERAVMSFMGGQPAAAYQDRGFELVASWVDMQLRDVIQEKGLVLEDANMDAAATVGCCVKRLD